MNNCTAVFGVQCVGVVDHSAKAIHNKFNQKFVMGQQTHIIMITCICTLNPIT